MLTQLRPLERDVVGSELEHDLVARGTTSLGEGEDEVVQGTRKISWSHPQILPGAIGKVRLMPRSLRLPSPLPAAIALAAAASVLLLSGCTGETPEPSGTAAPPTSSGTAAPTAEPTESAPPAVPFEIACDALLTLEQVYEFNPNFGSAPDFEPANDDVVAIVEEQGTACGWLNQTSGEIIEIGVSTPSADALLAHKNEAALGSNPVPTYGTPPEVEGYFSQAAGSGEAQVFAGPYRIVIASSVLFEPGDAGQLVTALLGNLPAT